MHAGDWWSDRRARRRRPLRRRVRAFRGARNRAPLEQRARDGARARVSDHRGAGARAARDGGGDARARRSDRRRARRPRHRVCARARGPSGRGAPRRRPSSSRGGSGRRARSTTKGAGSTLPRWRRTPGSTAPRARSRSSTSRRSSPTRRQIRPCTSRRPNTPPGDGRASGPIGGSRLRTSATMPNAIRALADRQETRSPAKAGPSRAELLESVRAAPGRRGPRVVARVARSDRARALRPRPPPAGPAGRSGLLGARAPARRAETSSGALERIDALERSRGRQPGTAYLRARVALLLGSEDPRQIAERASALAMSMSAFAELELLAAEAWTRAGDRKRALAYARDLAENPQVDPAVRARARAIVEPTRQSSPPAERPASRRPPVSRRRPRPPPTRAQRPPRSERPRTLQSAAPARRRSERVLRSSPSNGAAFATSAGPVRSVGVQALRQSAAPRTSFRSCADRARSPSASRAAIARGAARFAPTPMRVDRRSLGRHLPSDARTAPPPSTSERPAPTRPPRRRRRRARRRRR